MKASFAADADASEDHINELYAALHAQGLPLPTLKGISHHHWDHSYGVPYVYELTLASDKYHEFFKQKTTFDTFEWTQVTMRERLDK